LNVKVTVKELIIAKRAFTYLMQVCNRFQRDFQTKVCSADSWEASTFVTNLTISPRYEKTHVAL